MTRRTQPIPGRRNIILASVMVSAFAAACSPSVGSPPTLPALTPTAAYTALEQTDLQAWCEDFRELYYAADLVAADIEVWATSQGAELTQGDIVAADDFTRRYNQLYNQTATLPRPKQARDINDLLSEAYHSEMNAYHELYLSYTTGDPTNYDKFTELKREAERLTIEIIDRFNDLMHEYNIDPVDCAIG